MQCVPVKVFGAKLQSLVEKLFHLRDCRRPFPFVQF